MPDYVGQWDTPNLGEIASFIRQLRDVDVDDEKVQLLFTQGSTLFNLYISERQNPEIKGEIVDRFGESTFQGHNHNNLFKFDKTYSPEAVINKGASAITIPYSGIKMIDPIKKIGFVTGFYYIPSHQSASLFAMINVNEFSQRGGIR